MSSELKRTNDGELSTYQEADMFARYSKYKGNDELTTDTSNLSEEEKTLVKNALNQVFINPKFKMKHFTPMGQLTPYATLKQWLLELKTCEENLETFSSMIERLRLEIEILDLQIQRADDVLDQKHLQLEREKKRYDLNANKRRHASHYIERDHYIELINEYLEGPNGKTPDGRSWLEVYGTPEEEQWEKHYWTVRLARQGAMDVVSYGRISAGNLEAINQLFPDQRNDCLALCHEMSLRMEAMNDNIRKEVHKQLMMTDEEYARINQGIQAPRDANYVELDVSLRAHPLSEDVDATVRPTNNNEELLDVYRP
jgi:hypothetical protein